MKRDLKITKLAKKLVELSKDSGVVTESRVAEVLTSLQQVQHRHHLAILKTFLNYLHREVAPDRGRFNANWSKRRCDEGD